MSFEKTLNDTDLCALGLALRALLTDDQSHALWEDQYSAAVELQNRLEAEINARSERAKVIASGAPVRLVDAPAGSIGIEVSWQGMALCKWPEPNGDATCSFSPGGPAWYPINEQVTVIATGLSTAACNWVLTLPEGGQLHAVLGTQGPRVHVSTGRRRQVQRDRGARPLPMVPTRRGRSASSNAMRCGMSARTALMCECKQSRPLARMVTHREQPTQR